MGESRIKLLAPPYSTKKWNRISLPTDLIELASWNQKTTKIMGSPLRRDGYALEFDGVDDKCVIPHHSDLSFGSAVTIAALVKAEEAARYQCIVHKFDGTLSNWHLYVNIDGKVQAGSNDGTGWHVLAGTSVLWGEWHFLVGVIDWDNDVIRVYVDGVLENEDTTYTYGAGENSADVWIGRRQTNDEEFDGIIANLLVYNRALSASEISSLAADYQNPILNGLVLWLSPDSLDYDANKWYNKYGGGNYGTLYGPARAVIELEKLVSVKEV